MQLPLQREHTHAHLTFTFTLTPSPRHHPPPSYFHPPGGPTIQRYEDATPLSGTTDPVFGVEYVTDLDSDPLQFSITPDFDGANFAIDSSTGRITVAPGKSLDYEAMQYYKINVVIEDMKDGAKRGGKASQMFTITVLDANDAPNIAGGIVLPLLENAQVLKNEELSLHCFSRCFCSN